jgi:hypothetical protein
MTVQFPLLRLALSLGDIGSSAAATIEVGANGVEIPTHPVAQSILPRVVSSTPSRLQP